MNHTRFILSTCLLVGSFICAHAQDKAQTQPKTKLESFQAKTGSVIIKGFVEVGSVAGEYGALEVNSMEFRDAGSRAKDYGITIRVKESGRLETEHTSFIDYDEIDSLIKGLDYVSKIDKSVTQLGNFEATYKTKGEFEITTFSSSSGGVRAAVTSGSIGRARAFFSLSDLEKLRGLIVEAKAKLDAIK